VAKREGIAESLDGWMGWGIQIGCYRNYSYGGDIHKMSSRGRQFPLSHAHRLTGPPAHRYTDTAAKDFPGLTSLWQLEHKCNYHFILNDLCATRLSHTNTHTVAQDMHHTHTDTQDAGHVDMTTTTAANGSGNGNKRSHQTNGPMSAAWGMRSERCAHRHTNTWDKNTK